MTEANSPYNPSLNAPVPPCGIVGELLPDSATEWREAEPLSADRWKFQFTEQPANESIVLWRSTVIAKRAFDLVFGAALLALLHPLMLLCALSIKLIRRGERVILRDRKHGKQGKPFDQLLFNLYALPNNRQSRVLDFWWRLGMRQTPSLINILRGDMSFVGPEPASTEEYRNYTEHEFQRLKVRPGIASFWFLRKNANIGYDQKIACDIAYLKKMSLKTDLGILARTIVVQLLRGSHSVSDERIRILGVKFFNLTMPDALDYVTIAARRRSMWTVFFINADCLNISFRDREYYEVLRKADAVFPDGIGIHIASQMLHAGLRENTNGTDFFPRLAAQAANHGLRVFLLGAKPGVAGECARNLRKLVPDVQISGTHHGYFTPEEEAGVIGQINQSGADILLVGMGVPTQEKWIARNRSRLTPAVVIGVGGLFDFYSGKTPRAPIWMREIGLEWVYRILQEPQRMWKRYVVGNPVFLYRVLRYGEEHPGTATRTPVTNSARSFVQREAAEIKSQRSEVTVKSSTVC